MTSAVVRLCSCNSFVMSLLVAPLRRLSSPDEAGKMVGLVRFELTRPTMLQERTQHVSKICK